MLFIRPLGNVARLSQFPRSRPCHLTSSTPAEMRTSLSYIVIVLIYSLIRVVPVGVYKGVHIPVCEVGDVCHGSMHGAPCGHKQAPTPCPNWLVIVLTAMLKQRVIYDCEWVTD
jgi:hypothetical protein